MEKTRETGGVFVVDTEGLKPVEYGDGMNLYHNRAAFFDGMGGKDAPLVTLFFLAYNNLEKYTKKSIALLLKYTSHIDMELVLIDNGSTDETLDFFQSVNYPRKRICRVTKNHGAILGNMAASMELGIKGWGKYFVSLPNDVFVTKHWLDNLLRCMESDERIGVAVPMSDYVANYQDVDFQYKNFDDMQHKAEMFNQSDPRKWEERIRVIPTTMVIRSELFRIYQWDPAFIYYFSDDDLSFQYRRLGYRLMVCGDTFVHHGGSVVQGKDLEEAYRKGQELFQKKYCGIDAWNDTINFEETMVAFLLKPRLERPESSKLHRILGVHVRCGQPLLTAKNLFRFHGMENVSLSAYTEDPKYWLDLRSICDGTVVCGSLPEGELFDEIILGECLNACPAWRETVGALISLLQVHGRLAVKYANYAREGCARMGYQDILDVFSLYPQCGIQDINIDLLENNDELYSSWEQLEQAASHGNEAAARQMEQEFPDSCRFGQYSVGEVVVVAERFR